MSSHSSDDGERTCAAQVLTFALGDEVYAIDIAGVREIIQVGALTSMPLMPAFVRGVINLRGAVVPVIDLQARFGRRPARLTKKSCIVIFDGSAAASRAARSGERADLGLLVDAVSEVVELQADEIEPAPSFGGAVQREFTRGIGKRGGRFMTLLEPERAFDIDEMAKACRPPEALAA